MTIAPASATPPDQPDPMSRLLEQAGRLKSIPLWVLHLTPTARFPAAPPPGSPPDPAIVALLVDHIDWLAELEQRGVLVMSGPLDQELGMGPGLSVLRAANRSEAEAIAQSEPFHLAGLRNNTVQSWSVNEGSLTITVKLYANEISIG